MAAFAGAASAPVSSTRVIVWTLGVGDTGNAIDISDLEGLTVQVVSGGGGTAQIDISNDGVNFVGLTAALALGAAAPMPAGMAFLVVGMCPKFMRVSAVATASVVVTVTGQKRPPAGGL